MSLHQPLVLLVIAATALDGLLAGASLDQSIKQLPARRRIGVIAYSVYSRAADMGTGILWYAILGVGAALLTIVAAIVALIQAAPFNVALPLYLAAVVSSGALLHHIARRTYIAESAKHGKQRAGTDGDLCPIRALADNSRHLAGDDVWPDVMGARRQCHTVMNPQLSQTCEWRR